MNREIAETILNQELTRLRGVPYADLIDHIDKPRSTTLTGPDGQKYHIQSEAFWDNKKRGNIRVMVLVDDSGLRASLKPLSGDFIVSPAGHLI